MKRLFTLLTAATLLLCCGCSLAKEAPETDPLMEDRLIGVLITNEYLDLFDMEAWLNDNINTVVNDKDTMIDGDTSQYQGRIYAERLEEERTASDGTTYHYTTYKFPEELKGKALICPTIFDEQGDYTASEGSNIFSDTHVHLKGTDAGSSIELTATVYYDPLSIQRESYLQMNEDGTETAEESIVFYHNPVYQTPDGDVYVTSGSGHSYSVGEGVSIYGQESSYWVDQTFKSTVNGKTEELTNKVAITMKSIRYASKIVILEMSHNNKLLRTTEYTAQDFPNQLTVGNDTAYVIAETHSLDQNDETVITRQICTTHSEDEHFNLYVPVGNGYIAKQETKVITG